jgi:hypothetical protein
MWTRYDYLCTDCDALIEVTAHVYNSCAPKCICGDGHVINIGASPAYEPVVKSVTKDTKPGVVKINTNPYN